MKIIDSPRKYRDFINSSSRMDNVVFKGLRLDSRNFSKVVTDKGGGFHNVTFIKCRIGVSSESSSNSDMRAFVEGYVEFNECIIDNLKIDLSCYYAKELSTIKIKGCKISNDLLIGRGVGQVYIIGSNINNILAYHKVESPFYIIDSHIKGYIQFSSNVPLKIGSNSLNFQNSTIPILDFLSRNTSFSKISKDSPVLNSFKSCGEVCVRNISIEECDMSYFYANNWKMEGSLAVWDSNVEEFNLMDSTLYSSDYDIFSFLVYDSCVGKDSMEFPGKEHSVKEEGGSFFESSDTFVRYIVRIHGGEIIWSY